MSIEHPIIVDSRERITLPAAAATSIPVPFYFQANRDIAVAREATAGEADFATLIEGVDYSLAGAGVNSGGTVTLTVAADGARRYRVRGAAPIDRLTSVVQGGAVKGAVLDRELDRNRIIMAELQRQIGAALTGPALGAPAGWLNVLDFGADGSGTLAAHVAYQAAIDAAYARGGGTVYGPAGDYLIGVPLVLKRGVTLLLDHDARLIATAAMGAVVITPLGTANRHERGCIVGGIIDCAYLAERGIWLREFSSFFLTDVMIVRCDGNAVQAGSDDSDANSYELVATRVFTRNGRTTALPDDTHGFFFENCSDSHLTDCVLRDVRYGVGGRHSDCKLTRVHCWNDAGAGDIYAGFFVDGYDNVYLACTVDGPAIDGFRIVRGRHLIVAPEFNYSAYGGVADHAAAVNIIDDPAVEWVRVIGGEFKGVEGYELRADFDGDLTKLRSIFSLARWCNVVVGDHGSPFTEVADHEARLDAIEAAPAIAFGPGPHIIVEERQNSGTAGGTFTSGAWQKRPLNTLAYNPAGWASLANNEITLPTGKWAFRFEATASQVDAHRAQIYNVTDAAVVGSGSNAIARATDETSSESCGETVVTIAAPKAFSLRHRGTTTSAGDGFGVPCSFGGDPEIYSRVTITRIA